MNKKAKQSLFIIFGLITVIILIYVAVIVLAIPTFPYENPSGDITTSNSSQIIEKNISAIEGIDITKTIWNWDGVNYTLWNGLVLYMNMDNRSGLPCGSGFENDTCVADISGMGNNGTIYGGSNISWTPNGKYGGAFNFSGGVNYINISTFSTNFSQVFISIWIKENKIGGSRFSGILSNPFDLYSGSGADKYVINLNTTTIVASVSTTSASVGNWVNLMVNYNGTKQCLYVNGVQEDCDTQTGSIQNLTGLVIGKRTTSPFNGSIDDLMIFNRSLSASEVSQLYKSSLTKYNSQNWSFWSNQSTNNTLNSTQTSYNWNYYLCSSNSTGSENCTSQKTITQTIPNKVLTANFTSSIGNINDRFYGANVHDSWLKTGRLIDSDEDGSTDDPSNTTWHRETWLNGKYSYAREDMNLGSYYEGVINKGFESWLNDSVVNISLNKSYELVNGWRTWSYRDASGFAYQTTDAYSGNYALQLNCSSSGGTDGVCVFELGRNDLTLSVGKTYNFSLWVKGQGADSLSLQYGGINKNSSNFDLSSSYQQVSVIITPSSTQNLDDWAFKIDLNAPKNITIDDFQITENGIIIDWWSIGNLTNKTNEYQWASQNNIKILNIISYTPSFLANRSTNCVDNITTDLDDSDCAPFDFDIMGKIITDYVNRSTNDGQYLNIVDYEDWNEPDISFWLDNLNSDNQQKADVYIKMHNATRTNLKSSYPTICIGGTGQASFYYMNMTKSYLSNFSDDCFYSFHRYITPATTNIYTEMQSLLNNVIANCTYYGANCSRILVSEYNLNHANSDDLIKNTSSRANEYGEGIALYYSSILNLIPDNVSMMIYQWADQYKYNQTTKYPEYPRQWYSVQEPVMGLEYKPPYNVTKSFAHLCPAGGTVYQSSSDDSTIKVVTCKKGLQRSVIVINTDTVSKNVTVNITGSNILNLTNYLNYSQKFNPTNNISQLGIMDSYNILYLTEDLQSPTITIQSPVSGFNYSTTSIDFNITLDEEGDTCKYTLNNWATNYTMTKQGYVNEFKASNSTMSNLLHTVKFWCNDTFGNINNTVNVSFTVDTTNPSGVWYNITNNSYFNYNKNYSVNASDNLGIKNISLYINGTLNETTTYASGITNTILGFIKTLSDAVYTMYWTIYDWAGNLFTSDTYTVTIDTINPLISYGTGTANDYINTTRTNIYINLSITEINFANITFTLRNDTSTVNSTFYSAVTYTINWTNLPDTNYTYYVNITDLANNKNSTSIRHITIDTTSPIISLISPSSGSEDTDGIVTFSYNVTDFIDIQKCSINIQGVERTGEPGDSQTNNNITKNTVESFGFTNIIKSNRLQWYVTCLDNLNNSGNSSSWIIDTLLGSSEDTGGGGGGGSGIPYTQINETACKLAYKYLLSENYTQENVTELNSLLALKNLYITESELEENYFKNWQESCSSLIKLSLKPKLVCEEIYYFLSLNKNYQYSDLVNLKEKIDEQIQIPLSVLESYIDNYEINCYDKGYSLSIYSYVNNINDSSPVSCNVNIENFLDFGIPLGSWNIGSNLSCDFVNFLKYFIKIDYYNNLYHFEGIKILTILILAGLILLIIIMKISFQKEYNKLEGLIKNKKE